MFTIKQLKYAGIISACLLTGSWVSAQTSPPNNAALHYTVQSGETIYSLSKALQISQDELIAMNPQLTDGLKAGQVINVPQRQEQQQEQMPSFLVYKVKKNNTLHYIAKRFDVTVEDILKYNPEARNGIRKGDKLRIPDKNDLERMKKVEKKQVEAQKAAAPKLATHEVKPGETLYGISRTYSCSISELLRLNPSAQSGLKVGMTLQVPVSAPVAEGTVATEETPEEHAYSPDSFFVHLVQSGETFWSLERKFQTSREELEEYNPVLREGLKTGLRIRIPNKSVPDINVVPKDETAFEKYTVQKGETVYGLAKRFDITISELKVVNPVLEYRGLKQGETILIPKPEEVAQVEPSEGDDNFEVSEPVYESNMSRYSVEYHSVELPAQCQPNPSARFESYNVALLLPLYLEANDTINLVPVLPDADSPNYDAEMEMLADSFTVRPDRVVYPRSESFLEFYEGVLLAVDSLNQAGMNVKLNVFDTSVAGGVESILYQPEFRDIDLIIGPVFPEQQEPIAEYARMKGIPMVSPLSSNGNLEDNNPFYFKINPSKEYLIQQTSSYIADEYFDKNLIVLEMGDYKHLPEAELVNMTREKFFFSPYRSESQQVLFHQYNLNQEGALGLSRILRKDRENVFIIPSATEAQVSVAVTNLNAVAENYPVTLVGLSNFQRYRSIQTEYYHHTKLNLLSPYYIEYNSPVVSNFIAKYRSNYKAEPSQFSYQGYDVAFYFMSAMFNYGRHFIDCLPAHQVQLTQGEFYFEKVNRDGGYMNHGLFVIDYEPDFRVRLKGITGIPIYTADE